jgi:TonB family protein
MTPIAKDSENVAASTSPAAPTSAAPKSPAEARPQPVALEVPVTVNGARTVEGSDKREPFSEKSATVLVFGHGAVIRVSALLAPGQLVFLTNEKTKKEVVCQVVKSKTDGNAVGYVELRFTEPAPGFWGMRFPSDTVIPQAPARPSAPAPVPAAPKPTPPVPVAVQPAPPAPVKPPAPAAPVSPVTGSTPPVSEPKFAFPTPVPPAPFSAPPSQPEPAAPPAASVEAPPAPVAAAPIAPAVEAKPVAPITSQPVSKASDPSTEELKQQAARLQEQLSSLLFTEAPKPAAPIAASPEIAQKVLELASPNQTPEPPAIKPIQVSVPPAPKPTASSLESEEVKIPSWLAPLARETEAAPSSSNAFPAEGTNSDVESVIPRASEDAILSEAQESVRRPETAVFGGQLLGESSQSAEAPGGKSKAGLFIGIAASLLLVAGGVWYSRQPGNAISGLLSGGSAPAAKSTVVPETATSSASAPVARPSTPASAPARVNPPAESAPVASAPVERSARNNASSPAAAQRIPEPAVEEPKKPSLGDVHLATPAVTSHGASTTSSDPALDINASGSTSAPVSALGDSHRAGPVAPVPVGGDVKPAKLLKSVPPVYPDMARNQRVAGDVQIDALIDADGNVSSMKILSGSPLLHQAALNALKQWKYQPAELDGKPTSMHLTVTIQFRTQ